MDGEEANVDVKKVVEKKDPGYPSKEDKTCAPCGCGKEKTEDAESVPPKPCPHRGPPGVPPRPEPPRVQPPGGITQPMMPRPPEPQVTPAPKPAETDEGEKAKDDDPPK